MARIYYSAESLGESSTTSSSYQDKVTLSFTPEANSTYIIIGSWACGSSSTGYACKTKLYRSSGTATSFNEQVLFPRSTSNRGIPGNCAVMETFGSSPGEQTYKIQYCVNSSGTSYIKDAKIVAIKATSNDKYAESLTRITTTSMTFSDWFSLQFTPATSGNYLILATAIDDSNSTTNGGARLRIDIGGTSYNEGIHRMNNTGNYLCYASAYFVNLAASSQTIKLQYASQSTLVTAGFAYGRIVAIRLDDGFTAYSYDQDNGSQNISSTSYTDISTASGSSIVDYDHLVISAIIIGSNAYNNPFYFATRYGTTNIFEEVVNNAQSGDSVFRYCFLHAYIEEDTAILGNNFSNSVKVSSSVTATVRASVIILLQVEDYNLTGTITGTSDVDGTLYIEGETITCSGTIAGTSTVAGTIIELVNIVGSIAGTGTATGLLNKQPGLIGTAAGTSTLSAILDRQIPLSGAIAGTGTATGLLSRTLDISGSVDSLSTLDGILIELVDISGAIAGTSSLSAVEDSQQSLGVAVPGTAALSASITSIYGLAGTIAGTSTITGCAILAGDTWRAYFTAIDTPSYEYPTGIGYSIDHLERVISTTTYSEITITPYTGMTWYYGVNDFLNNSDWNTGGFLVSLYNKNTPDTCSVKCRINRLSWSGTEWELAESTDFSKTQYFQPSTVMVFYIPCKNWTAGDVTDLFCVEWYLTAPSSGYICSWYHNHSNSFVEYHIDPLTNVGTIAGTSTLTANLSGFTLPISGSLAGTSGVSGTLDRQPSLAVTISGTSSLAGALIELVDISGAIAGTATLSAIEDSQQQLSVAIAGAGTVSANLTVSFALSGTIAGTSDADGIITLGRALSGDIAGTTSLSAVEDSQQRLIVSLQATSALSGLLSVDYSLVGSCDATTTVTGGYLDNQQVLSGSITGSSTLSGTLDRQPPLSTAIAAQSSLSGSVVVVISLAGTTAGISDLAGIVTIGEIVPISCAISASSSVTAGYLDNQPVLSVTCQSVSGHSAILSVNRDLIGIILGTSTLSVTESLDIALTGSFAGSATPTADLTVYKVLSGSISGTSSLDGTITRDIYLTVTIQSLSSAVGILAIDPLRVSGIILSTSTADARISVDYSLQGSVSGTATPYGLLGIELPISGSIVATSSLTGLLIELVDISVSISGISSLAGTLSREIELFVEIPVTTDLNAILNLVEWLRGTIISTSTLTAQWGEDLWYKVVIFSRSTVSGRIIREYEYIYGWIWSRGRTTGSLIFDWRLAGTATGRSGLSARLSIIEPFSGSITSTVSLSARLTVTFPISGAIAGASAVTARLPVQKNLFLTIPGTSTVNGTLSESAVQLSGEISGYGTLVPGFWGLVVTRLLTADVDEISTITGLLGLWKPLAGTIPSTSTVSGSMLGAIPLSGAIASVSTVSLDAIDNQPVLVVNIDAESAVDAELTIGFFSIAGTIIATSTVTGAIRFLIVEPFKVYLYPNRSMVDIVDAVEVFKVSVLSNPTGIAEIITERLNVVELSTNSSNVSLNENTSVVAIRTNRSVVDFDRNIV